MLEGLRSEPDALKQEECCTPVVGFLLSPRCDAWRAYGLTVGPECPVDITTNADAMLEAVGDIDPCVAVARSCGSAPP
jgi:hypothetical protein